MVTVSPHYELKLRAVPTVLDALFGRRAYEKCMRALLAGLKRHLGAEGEARKVSWDRRPPHGNPPLGAPGRAWPRAEA